MVHIRKYGQLLATVLFAVSIATPLLDRPPLWSVVARLVAVFGFLVLGGALFVAGHKSGPGREPEMRTASGPGGEPVMAADRRSANVKSLIAAGVALLSMIAAFVLVRHVQPGVHAPGLNQLDGGVSPKPR